MSPLADRLIAVIACFPFIWIVIGRIHAGQFNVPATALVLQMLLQIVPMFFRRKPHRVTANPGYWLLALLATYWPFISFGMFKPGTVLVAPWVTNGLTLLSLAIATWARLSLGRNIGFVPAQRELVMRGAYAYVRHPIYTSIFVTYSAFVLSSYSPLNALQAALGCFWFMVKSVLEERFLVADPAYRNYLDRVPRRWFPGIAWPSGRYRLALVEHAVLLIVVLLYAMAAYIAASSVGRAGTIDLTLYTFALASTAGASALCILAAYLLYVILVIRPLRPVLYIWQEGSARLHLRERLVIGLPMLVIMPMFFSIITPLKMLIPVFNPYHLDPLFSRWDRWLAGGREPWEWLEFLLHYPRIIFVLNALYNSWFVLIYVLLLWQAFSLSDRVLRLQFFVAFMLSWILLGTGLATLLSSAGPCFYGQIVGDPNPYAGLMTALNKVNESVPVWALPTQKMLWDSYAQSHLQLGSGISAMPSMHLSDGLLFALLMWRRQRMLGRLMYLYLGTLVVGSIILGWHYALDGIVSFTCTTLIWKAAGALSHRIRALSALKNSGAIAAAVP